MNLIEFLQNLSLAGVDLWSDEGKLKTGGSQEVLTSDVITKLKQYKSEILELLRENPDVLLVHPLSSGQKGLWFLWQLSPQSHHYNLSFSVRICSNVDVTIWQKSFEALGERHPLLRSTFPKLGEQPVQQLHQHQELDFLQIDASSWSEEELYKKVVEAHRHPFNLETESVMRVRWFTCSEANHIMLLTIHHIALDGWSLNLIAAELPQLYQAKLTGVEPSLPLLKHSYQDYVRWEKELLEGEKGEKLWEYWQQKLAGELPVLNLPTDKPRPPIQTYNGGSCPFKLSVKLTEQLKELAQTEEATLYMTLLAAFQVLLYRYTAQEDILVGSFASGRTKEEFASIGYFVNSIVMRADLSGNPCFRDFLDQVRQTVKGALAHQDYPLALLVEKLQIERDSSRSPLFQAAFVLQKFPKSQELQKKLYFGSSKKKLMNWGGIKVEAFRFDQQEGLYDLLLEMVEEDSSLVGFLKYNTDLFDEQTIARMAGHFQNLLAGIVNDPQQRVTALPLMTKAELDRILVEWNNTKIDYPTNKCLHQLFEAQVEKIPDAVAVVFEEEKLTYSQLNSKANQLAHYLQKLGVGPEVLVGICVERSLLMIVGMLGILKAGGAYVPLDPNYPSERLGYTLEDAAAKVLLTSESVLDSLPEYQGKIVCLDTIEETISNESIENPASKVTPENLAYAIYTSGSTGKPKGVAIEHHSPVAFCYWASQVFTVKELAAVFASTSICFDLSVFEIFVTLSQGGQVILAENALALPNIKSEITLINTVPSAITELSRINVIPDSVKVINLAGEPFSNQLVQRLYQQENIESVYNLYGPSEYTTYTTFTLLKRGTTTEPTIGRPIANTQIYILDSHLQPVPIGVAGELYIGGDGLAKGYHNRPELTAEKFIPNPFDKSKSTRLYKTGDLARYLPDGNIVFIGRIDNQVKIRGFRIETGEIEAIVSQYPDVKENVVIAQSDPTGGKRLIVYIVPQQKPTEETSLIPQIRQFLKEKLPEYMIPAAFVLLDAFPLTLNGKIDRRALPVPDTIPVGLSTTYVMPQTETEQLLTKIWQEVLQVEKVGIYDNFFELGGHSLLLIKVQTKLQEIYARDISIVKLFQYPNISELSKYLIDLEREKDSLTTGQGKGGSGRKTLLKQQRRQRQQMMTKNSIDDGAIAIIGISGRFPKAKDMDTFWKNLQEGVESIDFFSEQELLEEGIDPTLLKKQNYVKAGAVLSDIELFDANFFNYNPREAEIIDPQQRLFLESAVEALEVAGYDSQTYSGAIGVYAGLGENIYGRNNVYPHLENSEPENAYQVRLGNEPDFLSTRVSYKLNLTGRSITVQTACSTSLVAVHLACESLLSSKCDMALAGGVSLQILQKTGYLYQEGMIFSPDGHCRTFDAKAKGTLPASGLGIVVLKRLSEAIADGDYIYAQIKGSAINNDGLSKVGYTAPSVEGQAAAISEAQSIAGIDPETITYIEAHGTGTPLGDPIEIAALTKAFRGVTDKKGFCAIGSLKTNMGHLDAAAGVAGLIKTVLALKHKKIPPSLNFETPNPVIDFANSPFYVNTTLSEWNTNGTPRRAGVSSFGIGGTNAHVVLEEAPTLEASSKSRPWKLLMLSAKTNSALETATTNLAAHLKQHPEINLADAAYTLQVGRTAFEHRRMLVCQNIDDALKALSNRELQPVLTHYQEPIERPVVFMFSGQGSQYVNMAQELYQTESTFRAQVDSCSELLIPHLGIDLRHILYPQLEEIEKATLQLKQTAIAQSAIFVVSYSLAILWQEWGVSPQATIGHSIGEYVAATFAGVFSLEDALALVAKRGELMQQQPPGAMLAVSLSEQECQALLGDKLSLAAINGLSQCVVSGPTEAIDTLQQHLSEQNVECHRLHTSHGFHSQMMEPVLEPFIEYFQQISLHPPEIPYISNVTGTWIRAEQATDPNYWAKHLRQPVRFAEGIQHFLRDRSQILLEVGPGRTLSSLAKRHPDKAEEQILLTSVRHPQEKRSDLDFLLNTLGQLWLAGVRIDWEGFYCHEKRYRIPLPTYPFERQRYWIADSRTPKQNVQPKPSIEKKSDIGDWFYIPSWKRSNINNTKPVISTTNLVFVDEFGLGEKIVQKMERDGQNVITVRVGTEFRKVSDRLYHLNPEQEDDYHALCQELRERNEIPKTILHLWSVTPQSQDKLEIEWVEKSQNLSFYSLLFLAKALGRQQINSELLLGVVTNNMQKIGDEALLNPEQATVTGPILTIGQEYPNIICRGIDVVLPDSGTSESEILIEQIELELAIEQSEKMVAYRMGDRWVQTFEPVKLELGEKTKPRLKPGGVYLITGGLGGIGLILAEHLAKTVQAKLILIGRSKFPPAEEWSEWLASHDAQDSISQKIHKIRKLEALGSEVLNICADVANLQQMEDAIAQALKRFGKLNGVIHAAGIVGDKSFQTIAKTAKMECEQQFQPKIKGTLVLAKTLEKLELDFCILMSSLLSVLGWLGFVAYSSANSFMDAFVHQHNQTSIVPWIGVNWDSWQIMEVTKQSKSIGSSLAELAILPEEGVNVFQRILSTNALHQIVVSTSNLQDRINQWVNLKFLQQSDKSQTTELSSSHSRPKLATSYIAPRDRTEQTIAEIWQQTLGIEQIGIEDDFFELGGDSLIAVQVINKLRETFQTELPIEAILNTGTIAKLYESIQATISSQNIPGQKTPQARSSLLVEFQAGSNNKQPLFLLHPVGGTAYFYRDLARSLGSDIPVYGTQAQGLDGKTELLTSIEEMATEYIKAIRTIQPNGAYFLGGASFGGTLAFEMAQQLHAEGEKVALLAMIDTPGPDQMGLKLEEETAIATYMIETLLELDKNFLSLNSMREQGNVEEQVIYAFEQAKKANLVPHDFQVHTTRQIIRLFKTNMEAMWNYNPGIYPGKIIFFRAQDRRKKYDPVHPEYPWIELAALGIEIHTVSGTHITMNYDPHVQVIAEKLKVCLEQNN